MSLHHHHTNRYSVPLGCITHVLAFIINIIALSYSIVYISEHGEGILYYRGWPGKLKYLTFWNMLIQPLFFLLCIINDIRGGNTTDKQHFVHRSKLQTLRDNIHATIAFPLGIFVVSTFWAIYAVNRELVFPKALDKVVPVWQNHATHTAPLVFLLLQKIFTNITYPPKKWGILATVSVALIYQIWILWIANSQDIWVYPVLKVLDNTRRTIFLVALWVVLVGIYFIGQWISKQMWWGPAHHTFKKTR